MVIHTDLCSCIWCVACACSDLSELVSATANAVMERIREMEDESEHQQHQMILSRL
jgi:hypothetical protein